jgi:Pentapeptide repeats (8 copies)
MPVPFFLPFNALLQQQSAAETLAVVANVVKVIEGVGIIFGALQLWNGRHERREAERVGAALARKAANYQAWQVINGAHGKGGSGGRVDALQDLVANQVSLAGVKLDGAWLEGLAIPNAQLRQSSLREAVLTGANLSGANLEGADLSGAQLTGGSLRGAYLKGADLKGAALGTADLSGADLALVHGWREIASISYAKVQGVLNPPPGFLEWARERGAVDQDEGPNDSTVEFSSQWRTV